VALGLGDPGLQAGVVRGRDVILARGFEVELARLLAHRLGGRVGRFVHVPSTTGLLASSASAWQLGFAGIEASAAATTGADLSTSYLTSDVAVVMRRGLAGPRRVADLRGLVLCAVRGAESAHTAASVVRPRRATMLVAGVERLRSVLRAGACDAALLAALEVGRFVAGQRRVFGAVAGRIPRGEGLVAVVPRGAGIDVEVVDRALERLRRDGTLARLARTWLGLDPAGLRLLR
jgi:ABC-type amino acid transport substrate-binding protein